MLDVLVQSFDMAVLHTGDSLFCGRLHYFRNRMESSNWITKTEAERRLQKNTIQGPYSLLYHPYAYVYDHVAGWHSSDHLFLESFAVCLVYHMLCNHGIYASAILCDHG